MMVDEAEMDKVPVTIGMMAIAIFPAVEVVMSSSLNTNVKLRFRKQFVCR
jgi:hypothetical protein